MNKKWILLPCFFLIILAISLMIPESEPAPKIAEEIKFSLYNEEIKNYSIYSVSVYDKRERMLYERLMHLTSEEEIKEFVDYLLSLKVTLEENLLQDETTYEIYFRPIRKENSITYIDGFSFYISKNFIHERSFEYYSITGEKVLSVVGQNILYDYIESKIKK